MDLQIAPNFTLLDQHRQPFNLYETLKTGAVVLFFYPKDDTPGCTKEACSFRDQFEVFKEMGAHVVGISQDSPESHAAFAEKYRLPYSLVADEKNEVRKAFKVGRDLLGLLAGRTTFIINRQGKIVHQFNSHFKFEKHVEEAKKVLEQIA